MAPRRNSRRATRAEPAVINSSCRPARTTGPQDTGHQDTNHNSAGNPNINEQADNGHALPNVSNVDQEMINQLMNQRVAALLEE